MSSRSFMDAIRSVALKGSLTEGANEKTSDGMTKDAKRFAQDLHKVTDPGVKHLVQKDSEAKDYEKMFKPDIEKFPTRLADMEPSQSVDKYVEYNSRPVQEAKKLSKKDDDKSGDNPDNEDATGPITNEEKHKKDCECKDCKTVSEIYAQPGTPAGAAYQKKLAGNAGKPALPLQAGQTMGRINDKGQAGRVSVAKPAAAPAPKPSSGAPQMAPGTKLNRPTGNYNPMSGTGKPPVQAPANPMMGEKKPTNFAPGAAAAAKRADMSGGGTMSSTSSQVAAQQAKSQTSKMGGGSVNKTPGTGVKVVPTSAPPPKAAAGKPAAAKPQVQKPAAKAAKPQVQKPAQSFAQKRAIERGTAGPGAKGGFGGVTTKQPAAKAKAPAGTNTLKQSYEIEWNGNSYVMNEAQIQALDAFIEKYGIMEGTAGEFIKKEMEHPEKLTAKGKKQKIKQSLAIYYSKKRRGENP